MECYTRSASIVTTEGLPFKYCQVHPMSHERVIPREPQSKGLHNENQRSIFYVKPTNSQRTPVVFCVEQGKEGIL